jgi:glutathione S-transferase
MQYFDSVLRKQPFIAGEAFSMADITVIGGLIFAGLVDVPVSAECEALKAWHARMQQRPSVKKQLSVVATPIDVAA